MNARKKVDPDLIRFILGLVALGVFVATSFKLGLRVDHALDRLEATTPASVPAPHRPVTIMVESCDDDRPNAPVRATCLSFDEGRYALLAWPYGAVLAPLVECGPAVTVACFTGPTDGPLVAVTLP